MNSWHLPRRTFPGSAFCNADFGVVLGTWRSSEEEAVMLGRREAGNPTVTKINEGGSRNGASAVYLVEAKRTASQTVPR